MTQQDFDILLMSRLKLIETGIYVGCQDRDSSRLRYFLDVETKTHRDWKIYWMLRPRPVKTGQMSIPRLHRDSCWSFGGHQYLNIFKRMQFQLLQNQIWLDFYVGNHLVLVTPAAVKFILATVLFQTMVTASEVLLINCLFKLLKFCGSQYQAF